MSGKSTQLSASRTGCKGCKHCGPTLPCEFILNTGHSPHYYGVKLDPHGKNCPLKDTGKAERRRVNIVVGRTVDNKALPSEPRRNRRREPGSYRKIDMKRFRELYAAGATDSAIAAEFGVHKRSVCRIRNVNGLPSNWVEAKAKGAVPPQRRTRQSVFDVPEVMAAYRAGACDSELARLVGAVPTAANAWRRRHGLPSNCPPGGQRKKRPGEGDTRERMGEEQVKPEESGTG